MKRFQYLARLAKGMLFGGKRIGYILPLMLLFLISNYPQHTTYYPLHTTPVHDNLWIVVDITYEQ